jgi:hypothetical protein
MAARCEVSREGLRQNVKPEAETVGSNGIIAHLFLEDAWFESRL